MKTIFRAVFYLRSNYVNKEGKTPVMLRIYLNNERLSIGSTGIAVQQSQWDSEKERLKGRTTEALSTNLELDNIQSGLQTIFKKLEMTDAISLEILIKVMVHAVSRFRLLRRRLQVARNNSSIAFRRNSSPFLTTMSILDMVQLQLSLTKRPSIPFSSKQKTKDNSLGFCLTK